MSASLLEPCSNEERGPRCRSPRFISPTNALAQEEPNAYWKASLLRLLAPWSGEQSVARTFLAYAQHADPLVRTAAVQALESVGGAEADAARQVLMKRLEEDTERVAVDALAALVLYARDDSVRGRIDKILTKRNSSALRAVFDKEFRSGR